MSDIFTDTEMDEQYQEDDVINQQEELVCDQDMTDEQNEFEQDFRDEFTEGAYFFEFNPSKDTLEAAYVVDSMQDITILNFSENCAEEIGKYHFSTFHLVFKFYLKYSKSKGFSARKSKTFKNSIGKVYKQKFVFSRQGFREEKYYTMEKIKKEPRLETRTGCETRMDVKFVPETGRWHIFYFSYKHNYDLLDTQFSATLLAHRKMSEEDIMQMVNMLKSGISTSQIFGLLASQAGGYEFVGYGPKDMYNEIARQRPQLLGDAARVLKKLEDMRLKDPQLYFKACHDSRGLFHNLFWSNGISQLDYQLFGDVIAFDTTYKKNKYSLSISHIQRAHVCNEGKIMLGDYKIPVFKCKWVHLIEEFGLEDKPWVNNMYEVKPMWATTYIRGSNADYESTRGVFVMQTCIEMLERFSAEVYTHEVFLLFQPFLSRAGSIRVLNIENNDDCIKYSMCKHGRPDFLWTVEFCQEEMIFMYTYLRMESFGISCEHIVKVLVDRDICSGQPSKKKQQHCSVCQMEGHKKTTCPWQKDIDNNVIENEANGSDDGDMYTEPTTDLDSDN
ncbi:protein FAR1-RELATED SEQUENCE 6-like [Arachis ipaensis]|uniref:protein FAR1-RELATED SEQUENCE 6-like n=1 Tax=Arachis ipaensis TaxID=130454 RepID=UPI0007AFCB3B|nr:protein FAR1-RELATED SEQUENCE 6-like [Arachis ipaensis]